VRKRRRHEDGAVDWYPTAAKRSRIGPRVAKPYVVHHATAHPARSRVTVRNMVNETAGANRPENGGRTGQLTGVRVVVTGATGGLGAAMADALLVAGATVAFASRPTARLDASVSLRRGRGLDAVSLPIEVQDPVSVEAAAKQAFETMGGVEVVVNNAGIGMATVNPRFLEATMPFFEVTPDDFRKTVATNLTGYFLVARAFAPLFINQGHGRFINVTANRSTMRRKGFVPYGPTRAGSEALSLIMVEDPRPHGVAVNLLLPGGATATGMV
jgi:NAD(P)-dependent dehydrogenase (short-subunit alcohol dehydrogenase family)